ncbi:WhiB family transcriptional regulator [Streptomyces sp. AA1529]|uniref:WhiB family transcriptional regulator n=1 Tax=Streptomyces sp. AA1529 TaxID=1203257 RepID=UPI0002D30C5D|nr:WhiB family transcriptional regulator [Streptomyces sp. AA1529]
MNARDWQDKAVCREDPDLFFPVGTTGPSRDDADLAKWICRERCYVRAQCLDHVLRAEAGWPIDRRHGITAGLSPRERLHLDTTRTAA